jgi:GxxExxY protein
MAFKHEKLTQQIIGICLEVFRELGHGFVESVYHKALLVAFREAGLGVKSEVRFKVVFRGHDVGVFVADMVVEDTVVLELKAVTKLVAEHKAQLINYLKASGIEVGLLLNFGSTRLDFHRLEHPEVYRTRDQQGS